MYDERGEEFLDCINNVAHGKDSAPPAVLFGCRLAVVGDAFLAHY
jgi:hypothetical protein